MPLDLERIAELGERRMAAQLNADEALAEAFDLIQAAYEAGERVNIKRVAELLGVTRKPIYAELDRRGIERLRAA